MPNQPQKSQSHNKGLDVERLVLKLRSKDRKILVADAEAFRKMGGGDAALALSKALVEIYNKGLQLNHIQIGAKG